MANNLDSNITSKLARSFLQGFEDKRVLSKNVNTQLLSGEFDPSSGETVSFKRPTDYKSKRTSTGDISGGTRSDIITGKASGTVQDYFTVDIEFNRVEQALKLDQLDELLAPAVSRIVTDLEVDFASFMMKNSGILAGTVGTAATTWDHIAEAGALMESTGVPKDGDWCYSVNPYTQTKLASSQRGMGAGGSAGGLISDAHKNAIISDGFAGMKVMTATSMASYTTGAGADRAGALSATPTATYVAHKDTMQQTLALSGFNANLVIKAGDVVQVAGRNRMNLSTRLPIIDDSGNNVLFTGVVTADVTLNGSGAGSVVISGPGIYEADGAYNTVDSALTSGDVVTILGSASTLLQPNLFWHKQAFGIGSVPIPKLYSTDTIATTKDGLQIRVSKYSDGDSNKQIVRFDLQPAYAVLNPFFAGHGYGS